MYSDTNKTADLRLKEGANWEIQVFMKALAIKGFEGKRG
jgi:hypothetical protein